MTTPSFTAEASIYRSTTSYFNLTASRSPASVRIESAASDSCLDDCVRDCGSKEGGSDSCLNDCQKKCGGAATATRSKAPT